LASHRHQPGGRGSGWGSGSAWRGGSRSWNRWCRSGAPYTTEGIARIEQHLSNLDALESFPPNQAMIGRLQQGQVEAQDLMFYRHELIESDLMNNGLGARDAHLETLRQQGIPYEPGYESHLYHPEVIPQFPNSFNPAAHP
jgi:hypothetical protein